MAELLLDRDTRLDLRGQAHGLDPVVLLGANGLTDAVLKEIDRALLAHELIKIRVPGDEREEREAIYNEIADKLNAARIQMIGKLLVLWRPNPRTPRSKRQRPNAPSVAKWLKHNAANAAAPRLTAKHAPKLKAEPPKKLTRTSNQEKARSTKSEPFFCTQ